MKVIDYCRILIFFFMNDVQNKNEKVLEKMLARPKINIETSTYFSN